MELGDIQRFSLILQENGDKVLDGSSKLSLTLSLLQDLNDSFKLIIDPNAGQHTIFQVIPSGNSSLEIFRDLEFLHDFIQKTIGLKVSAGVNVENFRGTTDISKFRSLKLLELHKVSVKYITGIKNLRTNLNFILCVKCLNCIEDILVKCGGDDTDGFVWNELREAVLSNNNLQSIDDSLQYAPFLQMIDLSHNKIKDAQPLECLPNLKFINLSYNRLTAVPLFSEEQSRNIQTLLFKNNYIENLLGLITLTNLRELDVSYNFLIEHPSLGSLPDLVTLQWLSLIGNPLSYHPQHRKLTARYLNDNTASVKFVLDFLPLSKSEKLHIGTFHVNSVSLPSYLRERKEYYTSTSTMGPTSSSTEIIATPSLVESLNIASSLHSRKVTRVREAKISEHNAPSEEIVPVNQSVTSENSLESSIHLDTKERIESLRNEYGSGWLHKKGGSLVQDVLGMEKTPIPILSSSHADKFATVMNLFDNESSISISPRSSKTLVPDSDSVLTEALYESATESGTLNEYVSAVDFPEVEESDNKVFSAEVSDDEPEWSSEQLFIVQMEGASLRQMILGVSLENGMIRECSEATGKTKTRWYLSTLLSYELNPNGISLSFDTVRRDKQTRNYIMESSETQNLKKLLDSILSERSLKENKLTVYRCMKCSSVFSQEKKDPSFVNNGKELSSLKCPNCQCTVVIEIQDEDSNLDISKKLSPDTAEMALPHSPSHSSIADAQNTAPRVLEVTAEVHTSEVKPNATLLPYWSAASLEESSSRLSNTDSQTRRGDSDIEVLSDPSQDSIEVLAVLARSVTSYNCIQPSIFSGSSSTPNRRQSSEEYRVDITPAVIAGVSTSATTTNLTATVLNATMGLTESSSSDSLTGSVCTAYENRAGQLVTGTTLNTIKPVEEVVAHVDEVQEKAGELVLPVGMFSTMLEGLFQSASKIVNMSPAKTFTVPAGVDSSIEFSYEEFTQIDHRIKLHIYLDIFDDETEELVWLLRGEILPHNTTQSYSGCIVMSTCKLYLLKIDGNMHSDEPQQWLHKVDGFTVDRLQMIFTLPWKQGVGMEIRQTSVISTVTSFYILCFLQDVIRTSNFFTFLAGSALPESCELNTATHEQTNLNIQQLLLTAASESGNHTSRLLCVFTHCEIQSGEDEVQQYAMGCLLITNSEIILCNNNLTWFRPDTAAVPSAIATQTLSNLINVELDSLTLTLNFLDETANKTDCWKVTSVTRRSIDGIVQAIQEPWEELFSIPLQINEENKKI